MTATPEPGLDCWIYKGSRHAEAYLYLRERDGFSLVPDELLATLGHFELVMEITLTADRKLARADVEKVMESLRARGYYFQPPPARSMRSLSGGPPGIH